MASKFKIIPAGHRVLVKILSKGEKSTGGIYLPEAGRKQDQCASEEAIVVEIGASAFKDFGDGEVWCAVNDTILIAKYSGVDKVDEETGTIYRVINDVDVIGIVKYEYTHSNTVNK